jgi:hypothetical protein
MFSLGNGTELRFLTRSRLFTDAEAAVLTTVDGEPGARGDVA